MRKKPKNAFLVYSIECAKLTENRKRLLSTPDQSHSSEDSDPHAHTHQHT